VLVGEAGEVREVKMRPGVGRRGLAPWRSSWSRKAVGSRGVEAARWHEDVSKQVGVSPLQSRAKG
jgi:hypothetical protein